MQRVTRSVAALATMLVVTAGTAGAQGGPPPGMGGGQRIEQMASLDRPLAGVDGLTAAQKDTLQKLEAAYKTRFTEAGTAQREMMMAARQSGQMPDREAMMKAREQMRTWRTEQLAAARGVLTSAQHPKFDENVKTMQAEEAERASQMRQRMGGPPPQ